MRCSININMDNAAFDDGDGGNLELARILERIIVDCRNGNGPLSHLHDLNGNKVGVIKFVGRRPARAAATPECDGAK